MYSRLDLVADPISARIAAGKGDIVKSSSWTDTRRRALVDVVDVSPWNRIRFCTHCHHLFNMKLGSEQPQ